MRKLFIAMGVGLFLTSLAVVPASAELKGDYIESRSADVYTGPCFANGQVGLVGDQAILAWRVKEGSWKGTDLNGLSIVAVVKASATLGDPYHNPYPAKSVLILDERATFRQRVALEEFARSMAGRLLSNVLRVETAPITLNVGEGHMASARLVAGNLARIETRTLCQGDKHCGNEFVYYPPLVKLSHVMPAFALRDTYSGPGLNTIWNRVDERSAFVGTFNI